MKIVSSFPAGNPSPEYVIALAAKLETYEPVVIRRLADLREGLPSRCKFLPSVAEVHEIGERLADQEARRAKYASEPPRRPAIAGRHHHEGAKDGPFRPYPKLWAAFAEEPTIIDALDRGGFNFDQLTEASRRLVIQGKDKARDYIASIAKVVPAHPHKGQDHAIPDTGNDQRAT